VPLDFPLHPEVANDVQDNCMLCVSYTVEKHALCFLALISNTIATTFLYNPETQASRRESDGYRIIVHACFLKQQWV